MKKRTASKLGFLRCKHSPLGAQLAPMDDDQITGSIERIIFASEETGFTVATLKEPKKEEPTCIVGSMPSVKVGETVFCRGSWKHHPRHGNQFEVASYESKMPSDLVGIQKYLESGMISGIGPVYAERIIDTFGEKTLEIIDKYPHRLKSVEGIGQKRLDQIVQCWNDQKSIRDLMIFLQTHNIRPSVAQKVFKVHGDQSIEVIKKNPYTLAKTIFGIGFKSADAIAMKLGVEKDSAVRLDSGIEYLLWELAGDGHVCYPLEALEEKAKEILDVSSIRERIDTLEKEGRIIAESVDEEQVIWVKPLFLAELGICRQLSRLLGHTCTVRQIDDAKAIDWVEEQMKLKLAKEQKEAIQKATSEKVHIITGGPGTGKSTITKGIIRITEKITDKILLAAPTGRAAKRMSEITRRKAHTIHALLEVDFTQGGFKKNTDSPLNCDLLIVDEASMIDTQLMHNLLKAIPNNARLILIGDIDQLPSVGPGNVLRDMIDSERLSVSVLTQIFRQARGSKIIRSAHSVNKGFMPELESDEKSDFFFIEKDDPLDIANLILYLIETRIPSSFSFHPIDQVQVLSPMKKGTIGTENLNHLIQQKLNPSDDPLMKMGRCFHVGDKVMQLRNNYDKGVFNGDVGRIVSIDREDQVLSVVFDGKEVSYAFVDLDELVLAYAVSIHKYQGSECPCIIIPVHTSHFKLLYRNLLYTGITRGRKLVILVGSKKAIGIACRNAEVQKRYTSLKTKIQQELSLHPV